MNKLNKTAYMFFIWAAFSLCGCAGKGATQMYLEAKAQDGQKVQQEEQDSTNVFDAEPDSLQGAAGNEKAVQNTEPDMCFVYVCGAVKHPGVYELPQGSRVYEAVAMAGGFRKNAYEKDLNQAAQIEDGQMIEVLTIKEHRNLQEQPQRANGADSEQTDDGRVDINTATAQQLMTLSGIGEAKAENIIAYRESNGGFSSPEELMNVNGIGEGVYARIQDKIKVIQ